jgi:glycosyltransferase involved in cell wall biosynthesis
VQVALDVTPLLGARTGVGRMVQHLLPSLPTAGVTPRPYALTARGDAGAAPPGTRVGRLPPSLLVRAWAHGDHPRLRRLVAPAPVGVVHGTNFVAPPTGLPTVLTIHDCSFVTRPETAVPVVRAFAPAVRRLVRAGAWVHVPATVVGEEVAELFGTDRVAVVPHGPPELDPDDGRRPTLTGGAPYVLALGTLEPRKNLLRLVAAYAALAAEQPDVHLVLAGGDGLDRPALDAEIGALPPHVRARVHLPGWVDGAERTALLRHAAVLAYPSLDEGFGLPLLEAMALGTPVVAARAGAIPEVAGDAAVLVDPLDVDALAGALAAVIGDAALAADLVARGAARRAAHSWEATAAGLATLYRRARDAGEAG